MYDPIKDPASTMSPGTVQTHTTVTQELDLNGNLAKQISHDYNENSINSLPSSKALFDSLTTLNWEISKIDPNHNLFTDNTVITLPLLPTTFDLNSEWIYTNWYVDEGSLVYSEVGYENSIKVLPEVLTHPGYYFFVVNISTIDSGKLVLEDTIGNPLLEMDAIGKYYYEIKVNNTDVTTFTFRAVNVFPSEHIKIKSIGVYRVTERIRDYLYYYLKDRPDSGDTDGISKGELQEIINDLRAELYTYVDNEISVIRDAQNEHINNMSNPHGTTAEQVGAAPKDHTHTPESIGAADREHTHEPEECGAAPAVHTHNEYALRTELEDLRNNFEDHLIQENPHDITPELIGAALKDHTHTPNEIGAANAVHSHPEYITESQVEEIVDNKVSGGTTSSNTGLRYKPMTIVRCPLGVSPNGLENSSIDDPVSPVIFPYIIHRTKGEYDYFDGVCSTNKSTVKGFPIWYAFNKCLTDEDCKIDTVAFSCADVVNEENKVLLQYEFHISRSISHFTIRKSTNDKVGGFPTSFRVYANDNLIQTFTDIDLSTSEVDCMLQDTGSIECKKIAIIVFAVNTNSSENWGAKISFNFTDVEDNHISLNTNNLSIRTDGSLLDVDSLDTTKLSLELSPDETKTPLYLFLNTEKTEVTNNRPVTTFFVHGAGCTVSSCPVADELDKRIDDTKLIRLSYNSGDDYETSLNSLFSQIEQHITDSGGIDQNTVFIGESMGGFWASQLATAYSAKCLLINPALRITTQMQQFLGQHLQGEDKPAISQDQLDTYADDLITDIRTERMRGRMFIILGTEDTIIPNEDTINFLGDYAGNTVYVDDGHSPTTNDSYEQISNLYNSLTLLDAVTTTKTMAKLSVDSIPYEYDKKRFGIPLLLGAYENDRTNPIWGSITTNVTSVDGFGIRNVYTYDINKYFLCNEKSVTITHTFVSPAQLVGCKLLFTKTLEDLNAIPDKIQISVYVDGSPDKIQIADHQEYLPSKENINTNQYWVLANIKYENITKIEVTLSVNDNKPSVGIVKFIPLLSGNFYNTATCTISDKVKNPFQLCRLDYVESYDKSFKGYMGYTLALGDHCIVPIDGLNMQPVDRVVHKVYNPFGTQYISATPLIYGDNEFEFQQASVVNITTDFITVTTSGMGRYCLSIRRLW